MHIVLLCLTDDPFDPPGHGGHGGSHKVMFDMGRHFVRRGARVTFVTRLNSPTKPTADRFGSACRIYRIRAGPAAEVPYFRCADLVDPMSAAVRSLAGLRPSRVDAVVSYNWISGAVALQMLAGTTVTHIHCVLALGRARLAAGEGRDKVSDQWIACEEAVFRHAELVVTCSSDEHRQLLQHYPFIDPAKIRCIPLGVDTDVFRPRPATAHHLVRRAAARFSEGLDDPGRRPHDPADADRPAAVRGVDRGRQRGRA